MLLKDKIAVVTGSSRGVGRAVALDYGKNGAKVVVNYTSSAQAADEVVEHIKSMGADAIAVKADVAQKADAQKIDEQETLDTQPRRPADKARPASPRDKEPVESKASSKRSSKSKSSSKNELSSPTREAPKASQDQADHRRGVPANPLGEQPTGRP